MGGENDIIYDQNKSEYIGSGVYGEVKRATYIPNDTRAAIKIINLDSYFNKIGLEIDDEKRNKYINKIKSRISDIDKILQGNNYENKNFTRYYDKTKIKEGTLYFGMELCNCNISTYMVDKYNNGIDIGNIFDILIQLNKNFIIMKNRKIVHGDIRLENILVNLERSKYNFKLSGFEIIPELIKLTKIYRPEVVCKYMPPEILRENNFIVEEKTDLWSIGILIYYLAFKEFPFKGKSCQEVLNEINKKNKKKTNFMELDNLIEGLLNVNKEQRLTWEQYFNHPFFHNKGFWIEYIIKEKIGEGQFSTVYKAINKNNKQEVAIKIIDFTKIEKIESNKNNSNDITIEIKQKIDNMERLYNENHNCFIEIYKKFESQNNIAIAMELGEFNLKKYIDNISVSESKASKIFYFLVELNKCFKFLEKRNKPIGDLKLRHFQKYYKKIKNYITLNKNFI
jgi:serine/threonine protein kinase